MAEIKGAKIGAAYGSTSRTSRLAEPKHPRMPRPSSHIWQCPDPDYVIGSRSSTRLLSIADELS
jgi:hypothetical protein